MVVQAAHAQAFTEPQEQIRNKAKLERSLKVAMAFCCTLAFLRVLVPLLCGVLIVVYHVLHVALTFAWSVVRTCFEYLLTGDSVTSPSPSEDWLWNNSERLAAQFANSDVGMFLFHYDGSFISHPGMLAHVGLTLAILLFLACMFGAACSWLVSKAGGSLPPQTNEELSVAGILTLYGIGIVLSTAFLYGISAAIGGILMVALLAMFAPFLLFSGVFLIFQVD
jgi:hypothetical protein